MIAVLAMALGVFIGYKARPQAQPGLKVFGPTKTFGEARELFAGQLAFFLGQQRPSDGMLFGEWARDRFAKRCGGLDPRSVAFTTSMQGPIKDEGFRWDVLIDHTGPIPAGCQVQELLVTVGGIMSVTGRIVPLAPDANIGTTTFGVDDQGSLIDPTKANPDSWWLRFLAGEAP